MWLKFGFRLSFQDGSYIQEEAISLKEIAELISSAIARHNLYDANFKECFVVYAANIQQNTKDPDYVLRIDMFFGSYGSDFIRKELERGLIWNLKLDPNFNFSNCVFIL